MGYLFCNAESAIAICDSYNWDFTRRGKKQNPRFKQFEIRDFSYAELLQATNGFSKSNFLGKGSHGSVYRALLDDGNLVAAVKKTTTHCSNGTAENEIEVLSTIRSPRFVNLLGFGSDPAGRKLIVVELMPSGSLYDLLHASDEPYGWAVRIRLALEVAKAVQCLHSSNPPVIHRDIKSSNVLIDGDGRARLGDFGLALRGHVEDVRVRCTPPAGTLGYLDPCYLAPGDLSAKSDVFSFGILLLEIITGRKAIDVNYSPPSVVNWTKPIIKSGNYAGIFDRRIPKPADGLAMAQLAVLAARCVRSAPELRPTMSEVVDYLTVIRKRVTAPIWRALRRRRMKPAAKYEPMYDATTTETIGVARAGSRRSRKVSSVSNVQSTTESGVSKTHRVTRPKSIGSVLEIKSGPSDQAGRRRGGGLAVKMPTVRLRKSRSTGVLQGARLVGEKDELVLSLLPNAKEPVEK